MPVMRAKKKPVIIECLQYTGENDAEVIEFAGRKHVLMLNPQELVKGDGQIFIRTLEGMMRCPIGHVIIKGVKGEFYPCAPDIFENTYSIEVERIGVGD
jgi:hypothetical protein